MTRLQRLATGDITTTNPTTVFTATSRTIVRTIDVMSSGAANICWGVEAVDVTIPEDESGNFWFFNCSAVTTELNVFHGGIVLEPGEDLMVESTAANVANYFVGGATNLL